MNIPTYDEILNYTREYFMENEYLQKLYGFYPNQPFLKEGAVGVFSPTSIEAIFTAFLSRVIHDNFLNIEGYVNEALAAVEARRPHTLRWYADMAKSYMKGAEYSELNMKWILPEDYTEEQLERMRIVKQASATFDDSLKAVSIKIATVDEEEGKPAAVASEDLEGIKRFLSRVKDAGQAIVVSTGAGNKLDLSLSLVYEPSVINLNTEKGEEAVKAVIEGVLFNIPFDSALYISDIEGALMALSGIRSARIYGYKVLSVDMVVEQKEHVDGTHAVRPTDGYFSALTINRMDKEVL